MSFGVTPKTPKTHLIFATYDAKGRRSTVRIVCTIYIGDCPPLSKPKFYVHFAQALPVLCTGSACALCWLCLCSVLPLPVLWACLDLGLTRAWL